MERNLIIDLKRREFHIKPSANDCWQLYVAMASTSAHSPDKGLLSNGQPAVTMIQLSEKGGGLKVDIRHWVAFCIIWAKYDITILPSGVHTAYDR